MNLWRRVLAGLGAALLLLLATIGGTASAGPANEGHARIGSVDPGIAPARDRALITLTDVSPVVVAPGTTVTIKGVVTAPSVGALLGTSLNVVRGTADLDRQGAVAGWAAQKGPARGTVVATVKLPTVDAGQSASFSIDVPASRVASSEAFAAIPISIEVTPQAATQPAGVLRTFLSWQARKEYVPLEIATVLPVTLDPDPGLFSSDESTRVTAWESAIGSESRVRRLIEGSAGHQVTLAVDPSVFGPSVAGSAGPAPATGSTPGTSPHTTAGSTPGSTPGSTEPTESATKQGEPAGTGTATPGAAGTGTSGASGTPAPDPGSTQPAPTPPTPAPVTTSPPGVPSIAGRAVTELGDQNVAMLHGRQVWALPYADADLAAAVEVDPTNGVIRDLVNRSSVVARRLDHPVRADVVLPADGLLPDGREAGLAGLLQGTRLGKAAGIVVNSDAITSPTPYTPSARRISATGTRLLGWDPTLSALLPSGAEVGVAPRQQFLAETLALLGERPGTERSLLVLGARGYNPDPVALRDLLTAIDSAPWLTPVPADSLLADSGDDIATRAGTPAKPVAASAPKPTLTMTRLARMVEERETLRRVATVLRDGASFEATYREVLDELASARWRWAPAGWTGLASSVSTSVRDATSAIQVVPRSFNFLAEQGTLTLTVENGLDFAIEDIRLVLAPTNPRMQVVRQPPPIRIGAESKTSVKVTVRAVAAGQADIRAFLTTADGTPIGQPAIIPVAANPLDSTIYWVGGVITALILVLGVARSLLRGTSRIAEIDDAHTLEIDTHLDAHEQEHGREGRST
ncbi:MAG: DUF6049 family protein [Intrasporangium sp.]|uniref:DUF6049 family protein n=1 Tax=Intrasporangium sp. TaxID=1925024 RepID=UPI003F80D132